MNDCSICKNCKLRVGDYCFCRYDPEKLTDYVITECDYYYDDNDSTYYEFIDGFQHCDKLKKEPVIANIEARIRKEIERPQSYWNYIQAGMAVCPFCGGTRQDNRVGHIAFCNKCGADLRGNKNEDPNK